MRFPAQATQPVIKPDDPRCQPDAYLSLNRCLYEVIGWESTGPHSGMLHVRNSRTEFPMKLTASEAAHSKLERAAPVAPDAAPEGWGAQMAA